MEGPRAGEPSQAELQAAAESMASYDAPFVPRFGEWSEHGSGMDNQYGKYFRRAHIRRLQSVRGKKKERAEGGREGEAQAEGEEKEEEECGCEYSGPLDASFIASKLRRNAARMLGVAEDSAAEGGRHASDTGAGGVPGVCLGGPPTAASFASPGGPSSSRNTSTASLPPGNQNAEDPLKKGLSEGPSGMRGPMAPLIAGRALSARESQKAGEVRGMRRLRQVGFVRHQRPGSQSLLLAQAARTKLDATLAYEDETCLQMSEDDLSPPTSSKWEGSSNDSPVSVLAGAAEGGERGGGGVKAKKGSPAVQGDMGELKGGKIQRVVNNDRQRGAGGIEVALGDATAPSACFSEGRPGQADKTSQGKGGKGTFTGARTGRIGGTRMEAHEGQKVVPGYAVGRGSRQSTRRMRHSYPLLRLFGWLSGTSPVDA